MRQILISQAIYYDKKRGTYYDYIDSRLVEICQELGFKPLTISNFFKYPEKYLKKLHIKGIVLSGGSDIGKFPLRDKNEIKLISLGIKTKIPLLGICRGMQMINHYFNGNLVKIDGHVRKKHVIENIFAKRKISVNSYHNYAINIKKLNKDLKPIFKCKKDGSIEAVLHKTKPIMGIMWHPEREKKLKKFDREIIQQFLLRLGELRKKYYEKI